MSKVTVIMIRTFKDLEKGSEQELDAKTADWLCSNDFAKKCECEDESEDCGCSGSKTLNKSTDGTVKEAVAHIESLAEAGEEGFEKAILAFAEGDTRVGVKDAIKEYQS